MKAASINVQNNEEYVQADLVVVCTHNFYQHTTIIKVMHLDIFLEKYLSIYEVNWSSWIDSIMET